jgi:AraC-like DNA-binding protein
MPADLMPLDPLTRGAALGASAVLGLTLGWTGATRSVRIAGALLALSIITWLGGESLLVQRLFGNTPVFIELALPVAGFFWLFVQTVFDDEPIRPVMLAPAAVILVLGMLTAYDLDHGNWRWSLYNGANGLVVAHAGLIVARGWRGDLLEGRRRLRAMALGVGAVFAILSVVIGFAARFDPTGPWRQFTIGGFYGGLIFGVVILMATTTFLQARGSVFGAPRRIAPSSDGKAEAAERQLLGRLSTFMADGGWRREGLTIGAVAEAVGEPEHRLRRLINQRLGHRNFADFVNGHRIEAAKARLADPAEVRVAVATIAFDLGFGSLGPFNRAFRDATGASPTEWRKAALAAASPEVKEAV